MAFLSESSPKKIIRSRQPSLILRTNLSAWAFKFGDRGGNCTDWIPASASMIRLLFRYGVALCPQNHENLLTRRLSPPASILRNRLGTVYLPATCTENDPHLRETSPLGGLSMRLNPANRSYDPLDRLRVRQIYTRRARQITISMWKEIGIQFGTVLGIVIGLIISPAIFLWSLIKRARAVHAEGVLCTAEVVPIDVDEPGRSIGARLAGPSLVRFSGTTNREGKEEQGILGLALRTRLPRDRDGTPEVGDQDIVFGTFESFVSLIFRKDSNRVDPHDYLLNEYDSVAPWRLPEIGIVRLRILRVLEAPAKGSGATRRARLEEDIRDGFAEMLL